MDCHRSGASHRPSLRVGTRLAAADAPCHKTPVYRRAGRPYDVVQEDGCGIGRGHRVHRRRCLGAGAQDRAQDRAELARSAISRADAQPAGGVLYVRHAGEAERKPEADAGPGAVVEADLRPGLGIQAAAGREIPRRFGLHGRGRRVHLRARRQGAQQPGPLHDLYAPDGQVRDRRSAHLAHPHQHPRAAAAARRRGPADPVQEGGVGTGARRQDLGRAQRRQRPGRHRPVQVRVVAARQQPPTST